MSIISLSESDSHYFYYLYYHPEKESYSKDEDIILKPKDFSSTDMKIIQSKNTCMFKFIGKSNEANKLVNAEERKECYNVYYKTCFFIPDNHLDK